MGHRKVINWDKYDHLIGAMSDRKIANTVGCNHSTVSKRRYKMQVSKYKKQPKPKPIPTPSYHRINWQDYEHLLGKIHDTELAEMIGCSPFAIWRRRGKYNIPAKKWTAIDWQKYDHLLGAMTDSMLANKIGCTHAMVTIRRNKLGINRLLA